MHIFLAVTGLDQPLWALSRSTTKSHRSAAGQSSAFETAASHGFWDLDMPFLQAFGKHIGCDNIGDDGDMFNACCKLCAEISPGKDEEDIIYMCAYRLVHMAKRSRDNAGDQVLQLEEASEFLDKDDHKELKKGGGKAIQVGETFKQYVSAMQKKKQSIKGNKAVLKGFIHRKLPPEGNIPHAHAKLLTPPGSFVWRNLVSGAWLGRMPPFGEHSRSWTTYGERGALIMFLKMIWTVWCLLHAEPLQVVPIEGLFEESDIFGGEKEEPKPKVPAVKTTAPVKSKAPAAKAKVPAVKTKAPEVQKANRKRGAAGSSKD